ncbi:DUF6328 family protein [Leucobacter tenebrionis]|uniref:DUF6328 family protein n=1 Tax=Leucobacter tenebrionis TaxID=2873270 RepID=UPI001CA6D8C4|nr:DUF6328 family protein [Leucobacter tenebrionis]QZY51825.1 DUF6328 family protein [Leucobacter tenebrionis]
MDERRAKAADDGRGESANERADRNWNEILQEVRVTQTCTQILGGFLLAVAFQRRFTELDEYQLVLYLVLVALAGTSTLFGLSLVVVHRRFFGKRQKMRIVRVGNRLLMANLAVVALLIAGVTSLIFDFTVSRTAGVVALVAALLLSCALWLLVPLGGAGAGAGADAGSGSGAGARSGSGAGARSGAGSGAGAGSGPSTGASAG